MGKHSLSVRQDLVNVLNLSGFKLNRLNHTDTSGLISRPIKIF